ncbi:MAG: hypothetical protein E6H93_08540 [Chloroflexi bacterium]|nr:MAG: hypothetical protein E6H93_08540 [Chloroflexota bacterium]
MQAYQSPPCLYCGATWNPPGAQTCVKCHNLLPAMPPAYAPAGTPPAPAPTAGAPFPGPTPTAAVPARPGFYRSPLRTFVFGVVAGDAYLIWWCFQLLGFAQRERFKGAGSPWWVLLPFGNLLYISRAFKGVADGEAARLGRASFSVGLANLGLISMLILSRVAANIYGMTGLALDATVAVITAGVLTMVQRSANAYQASAHPELGPAPQGMAGRYTWGEVVALIIGVILTLLLIAADLAP